MPFNSLGPRQNGRDFADDNFKCIFVNENVWILIEISLKFVPKGPINNISALVQIKAWRRSGDKPISELMLVIWPKHICVARPQWVKANLGIFTGNMSIRIIWRNYGAGKKLQICGLSTGNGCQARSYYYVKLGNINVTTPSNPALSMWAWAFDHDAETNSWASWCLLLKLDWQDPRNLHSCLSPNMKPLHTCAFLWYLLIDWNKLWYDVADMIQMHQYSIRLHCRNCRYQILVSLQTIKSHLNVPYSMLFLNTYFILCR